MGNSASKAAQSAPKAAAAAGRRQYPSTSSILNSATSTSPYPSSQTGQPPNPTTTTSAAADARSAPPPTPSPSQVHPDPAKSPPSDTKASHIDLDGRDPQFASSLRKLGPAVAVDDALPNQQRFPTSSVPPIGQQGQNIFPPSPSASSPGNPNGNRPNSSVRIVQARERINTLYARERDDLGRASFAGRTLISAKEISDVLRMSASGVSSDEIERKLRLQPGLVKDLVGARGLVENV